MDARQSSYKYTIHVICVLASGGSVWKYLSVQGSICTWCIFQVFFPSSGVFVTKQLYLPPYLFSPDRHLSCVVWSCRTLQCHGRWIGLTVGSLIPHRFFSLARAFMSSHILSAPASNFLHTSSAWMNVQQKYTRGRCRNKGTGGAESSEFRCVCVCDLKTLHAGLVRQNI